MKNKILWLEFLKNTQGKYIAQYYLYAISFVILCFGRLFLIIYVHSAFKFF